MPKGWGMEPHHISRVEAAIDAHAERRSLQQLAQSGKQHLRVLSREQVLQLVQAIVEQTVGENGDDSDRERIVAEAQARLTEFTERQAELEEAIRQRDDRLAHLTQELADVRAEHEARAEARDEARAEREAQTADLRAELAETRQRLATARGTIEGDDHEIERMAAQARDDERQLAELRELVQAKDDELRAAEHALARARDDGLLREVLDGVRGRVDALQHSVRALADRPVGLDRGALDALVAELAERESRSTLEVEERFAASLDRALEQIGRTVRAAKAPAVDGRVEATELLVERFFDGDSVDSNSGELDLSERTSDSSIDDSLHRLRALRGGDGGP